MKLRDVCIGVVVITAAAASFASMAGGREKRVWVDPPADIAVDRAPEPALAPVPKVVDPLTTEADVEVTGSVQHTEPSVSPFSQRPCRTRTYTVDTGATVRVHACR
jgi:hypothetical protein